MSDQSSTTQKPKPGSLRDRIAAFEKSATAGGTPVSAPPPRPKPAGFATWKPKQTPPSPPPPSNTQNEQQHVQASSSSMSASDARESITKGASLKERMAALQNKGAFGAPPPPVGPKPVVERPKWKPPPVLQSDEADGRSEGGIPAIEKSVSPLPPPPLATGDSVQSERDTTHGTSAEAANRDEDAETTQDPEEEERQRRAAIAARMARLGGARVGMAPLIIGKKPLVRKPTQEEQQKPVEDTKSAGISLHSEPTASPEEQHPSLNEPGLVPSRRSSMNATAQGDSGHSPKIPTSMPVPAVPRRPGPSRKKPSKPTTSPPEPPKEEPAMVVPGVDIVEPTPVPVHDSEDPEATLGTSTVKGASSTIEVEALADLEEPMPLHDDSEKLEKPEVVTSAEPASSPPLSAAHSPVLQQADLPLAHISRMIDTDEEPLQPSSPLPPTSAAQQPAVISVPERTSVIEHEEVKDNVAHKTPIAERLGGIDPPTSPGFSPDTVFAPEAVHSEPPKSIREDSLHEDGCEVVDNLDKPADQNPRTPLAIPAHRTSTSSAEFDAPEFVDAPQIRHTSTPLEQRPVPLPRRIIPAAFEDQELVEEPESDGEAENLARSHLLIPPPKERRAILPIQDEDDGDGSENDAPALPVPHRRSMDMRSRSIPESDSSSEPDTDHDGQPLPVPPRPTTWVVPPLRSQESSQYEDEEPRIVDIRISTPISLDREVMDEDEGDPIDPDFHIPSRRASHLNLAHREPSPTTLTAPPLHSPPPPIPGSRPQSAVQHVPSILSPPGPTNQPEETAVELEENASERQTIAERMARLGGIKFGNAPVLRPISSAVQESERMDIASIAGDEPDEPSNEEEEERARKERIAAKLASMGGMRIGMLPMGMSSLPAKGTQFREETVQSSPPIPVAPVRPSRLAPQPPDAEPGTESSNTSDDGVKVEAEESEAEEVNYQDAEPEEMPPIPSRSGRPTRRQSSGDVAVSPPPPARRPPVPATPPRRMSVQVASPQATPQRKDSSHTAQYDYVMVDQIESQETLPTRRTSLAARSAQASKTAESQENISSQWELPSMTTSTFDLGGNTDLSASWTDTGETSPSQPIQSPSLRGKARRQPSAHKSLSVDDLIALWGKVGVQVCEVATTVFEKSKKSLIGDGTYAGFVKAVLAEVPNAAQASIDAGEYGYLVYSQSGGVVQKRASEIMPGDIVEVHEAKFKGHKGLQTYQRSVGDSGELLIGIVAEFETKKSKMKVFQANQHVGQQTVELVSYRLEDLKSGTFKVYRVLEAA